ncbi:amidohydrolase family protein [Rhodovibrionaceae bacterium A322]
MPLPPAPSHAPYCAAPDGTLRRPVLKVPPLSCDSHAHVCGPQASYPYAHDRIYTPPDALPESYAAQLITLGIERAVLVQPSVYGTDNRLLMDALAALPQAGIQCRAVAVLDPQISDQELHSLHAAGVRGVRFNLVDVAQPSKEVSLDGLRNFCQRLAPLGWHAEFLIHVDDHPDLDSKFADFPVPIVVGHLGYVRLDGSPAAKGFQGLLRLAQAGNCWVKLTGPYRICPQDLPYPKAADYARALLEAAPERLVWGTDWPHVMVKKAMPNDADLLDLLTAWGCSQDHLQQILVDNPAELYGF